MDDMEDDSNVSNLDSFENENTLTAAQAVFGLTTLAEQVEKSRKKLFTAANENNDENDLMHRLNLPENTVTLLRTSQGSLVFLIGTAHFSEESNADVRKVIQTLLPDVVLLELCRSRQRMLHMSEESIRIEAEQQNIQTLRANAKTLGFSTAVMHYLMVQLSNFIMKQVGMAPGGEFRAAFQEASEIPFCRILLGDRDVRVTLRRTIALLGPWAKLKFFCSMLRDFGSITKEDIEQLKNMDLIEQLLHELSGSYPEICQVLVDERDRYLAYSLHHAATALQASAQLQLYKNAIEIFAIASSMMEEKDSSHSNVNPTQLIDILTHLAESTSLASSRETLLTACQTVRSAEEARDNAALRSAVLLAANAVESVKEETAPIPCVVVGVVGMGHVAGIKRYWSQAHDLDVASLCRIPQSSLLQRSVFVSAKVGGVAVLCWCLYRCARQILSVTRR